MFAEKNLEQTWRSWNCSFYPFKWIMTTTWNKTDIGNTKLQRLSWWPTLRHPLNYCQKTGKKTRNKIIALQGTMSTNQQRLQYGWRWTNLLTPGTGHGTGCVTLKTSHKQPNFDTLVHLRQRGHIFKATLHQKTAIIANISSPTGQTREKTEFFRRLQLKIEAVRDPADDLYLLGDFNTVFEACELQARSYRSQKSKDEKGFDSVNHSYLKEILMKIGLGDFIQVFKLL